MRRVALLGLSGVGKSTLLRGLSQSIAFVHLQASDLIKAEQAYLGRLPQSSEALRTGPVFDNQALLVAGFLRAAAQIDLPIVFDGHSVIDSRDGLIELPADVFRALNLDAICLLHAAPSDIVLRRAGDKLRQRPMRSEQELDDQQRVAIEVARRVANELHLPFRLMTAGQLDIIECILSDSIGN